MPTKCNSAHTSLQNDQGPKSTNLCIITPHRAPTKCRPWIREKNIGISAHQAEKKQICLLFFSHSNSLHKVVHLLTFWPPARPRPRPRPNHSVGFRFGNLFWDHALILDNFLRMSQGTLWSRIWLWKPLVADNIVLLENFWMPHCK